VGDAVDLREELARQVFEILQADDEVDFSQEATEGVVHLLVRRLPVKPSALAQSRPVLLKLDPIKVRYFPLVPGLIHEAAEHSGRFGACQALAGLLAGLYWVFLTTPFSASYSRLC